MNAIRGRSKATGQLEYFLAHAATVITHEAKSQTKTTVEERLNIIDGEDGLLDNLSDRILDVEETIPQAATGNNQLADKNWVQGQLENIIGVAGGDSDTVINKFNEVVAFLNGIAEGDPNLAAQLLAINTEIAKKATILDLGLYVANGSRFEDREDYYFMFDYLPAFVVDAELPDGYDITESETHHELVLYKPAVGAGTYGTIYTWTTEFDSVLQKTFWVRQNSFDVEALRRSNPNHPLLQLFGLNTATTSVDGMMSKTDKSRLDIIHASGIEGYLLDTVDVSTLITSGNQDQSSGQQEGPGDNPTVAPGDPEESLEPQNP